MKGEKYGYLDRSGKVIIEAKFDFADSFSEDLAVVAVNNKVGYINRFGDYVVKPQFENGENFSEGFAAVKKGGLYGFIRKDDIAKEVVVK